MTPQEIIEKIENLLSDLRQEIDAQAEDDEMYPHAHFPKMWDFGDKPGDGHKGPPPEDAGTIYVVFAEDKPPFSFSLSYLVDDLLDGVSCGDCIDEIHMPAVRAIAAALRAAADRLEFGKQG